MRTLWSILRLIRFHNCLMAALGVAVGASLTPGWPRYFASTMAALAALFTCAAGNAVNDLLDQPIDRINRPDRVLPRRDLSRHQAVAVAIVCSVAAFVSAWPAGWSVVVMVFLAQGLLVAYNFDLKRIPLLGNALVATLGGLTFITGGLAISWTATWALPGPLVPAVFAALLHLVREIVKDIEDLTGDTIAGTVTWPQVVGRRPALATAGGGLLLLVTLTLVVVSLDWYGPIFRTLVIYFIDMPLVGLLIAVWLRPSGRLVSVVSGALKVGMALGLAAFLLS